MVMVMRGTFDGGHAHHMLESYQAFEEEHYLYVGNLASGLEGYQAFEEEHYLYVGNLASGPDFRGGDPPAKANLEAEDSEGVLSHHQCSRRNALDEGECGGHCVL